MMRVLISARLGSKVQEAAKKIQQLDQPRYKYHSDYDYFYRMIIHEKLTGLALR